MDKKNIYIVGSINTDLVISSPYMPKNGETLTGGGFSPPVEAKEPIRRLLPPDWEEMYACADVWEMIPSERKHLLLLQRRGLMYPISGW